MKLQIESPHEGPSETRRWVLPEFRDSDDPLSDTPHIVYGNVGGREYLDFQELESEYSDVQAERLQSVTDEEREIAEKRVDKLIEQDKIDDDRREGAINNWLMSGARMPQELYDRYVAFCLEHIEQVKNLTAMNEHGDEITVRWTDDEQLRELFSPPDGDRVPPRQARKAIVENLGSSPVVKSYAPIVLARAMVDQSSLDEEDEENFDD